MLKLNDVKNKLKLTINTKILPLVISGTIGLCSGWTANSIFHGEKICKISKTAAKSYYSKENNDARQETESIITKNEIKHSTNKPSFTINYDITDRNLQKLNYIEIDARSKEDFEILTKYCHSLTNISIKNADELTNEKISIIEKTNINSISLDINIDNLFKNPTNKINIEKIANKITNINCSYIAINDEELITLALFNFINGSKLEKIPKISLNNEYKKLDLNEIKYLNDKLDDIIQSLNLDRKNTKEEKIRIILLFVEKKIQYDSLVNDYNDYINYLDESNNKYQEYYLLNTYKEYKTIEEIIQQSKKIINNYNKYCISTILKKDANEVPGICCNYSALTSMLCLKAGIECYDVGGYSYSKKEDITEEEKQEGAHAWNLINIDGKYYNIDPTRLDDYDITINDIENRPIFYNLDGLYDYIVYDPWDFCDYDENGLMCLQNNKLEYCNKNIEGKIIVPDISLAEILAIITSVYGSAYILDKKQDKKEKKLTKN